MRIIRTIELRPDLVGKADLLNKHSVTAQRQVFLRQRDEEFCDYRLVGHHIGALVRPHGVLDDETAVQSGVVEKRAFRIVEPVTMGEGNGVQVQDTACCPTLDDLPQIGPDSLTKFHVCPPRIAT